MLLIISLGVYITLKLNQLNHLSRQITSIGATNIKITEHLLDDMFPQVGFEKKYLISRDQDFYEKFWEIKEHFTKDMERLESHMGSTKNKKFISEVKNLYERVSGRPSDLKSPRLNKCNISYLYNINQE